MTASLLARKGDASPSLETLPPRPSVFDETRSAVALPGEIVAPRIQMRPQHTRPAGPARPAPPPPTPMPSQTAPARPDDHEDKPRRIMITMSADDYERLSIAAIKKDTSRHAVVHAALEHYFQQLAAELPRRCACMAEGACCA